MPTIWTKKALAQTGWDSNNYPPGTQFVLIAGVVQPVDADGNPVPVRDATPWTEAAVASTSFTEKPLSATSWSERSL